MKTFAITLAIITMGLFGLPLTSRADNSMQRIAQFPLATFITKTNPGIGSNYDINTAISQARSVVLKQPGVVCTRWEWRKRSAARAVPEGLGQVTAFSRYLAPSGYLTISDATVNELDARLDIGPHTCARFPVVGAVSLQLDVPAQNLGTAMNGEVFYPTLAVYWAPQPPKVHYTVRQTGDINEQAAALEPWTQSLWLAPQQVGVGNIDVTVTFHRGQEPVAQCFFDGASGPIEGMYRCLVPSEAVYYSISGPSGIASRFAVLARGAEWD